MAKEKKLYIYYKDGDTEKVRYVVNKWQWQDSMMGEQFITFSAQSENPIPFAIGDYCRYRGETFTLNYVPSATQSASIGKVGNGFTYDTIKFDSYQDELTRCLMRDITPTTGLYIASVGTNYTGSTNFALYCGEIIKGGKTYTPVCALAAKMQANLDAMYWNVKENKPMWSIIVNTETFHNEYGQVVYDTHTEEKVLTFANNYVSQALAMVYDVFKLNYCIKGRTIYIGYELGDITNYNVTNPTTIDQSANAFSFGYGKGNPSKDNPNKGLFQLKKIANPSQQIITRLRAFGSKKNMPYRYYNKRYDLSQSLFPVNLMLPDTFRTPTQKATANADRKKTYPTILDVQGETNDSFIEKNDNAAITTEGIREGSAFWDGSNEQLEEIYPTIEGTTYGELRSAGVPDQLGITGPEAFAGYADTERIDEILDIDIDTNIGNGINYDEATVIKVAVTEKRDAIPYPTKNMSKETATSEKTIAEFKEVAKGRYILTQSTQGVCFCPIARTCYDIEGNGNFEITIIIQPEEGTTITRKISTRKTEYKRITYGVISSFYYYTKLDKIPFPVLEMSDDLINITSKSNITIKAKFIPDDKFRLDKKAGITGETDEVFNASKFDWSLSNNNGANLEETPNLVGNLILRLEDAGDTYQSTPFHLILKDIGFDITAAFYADDKHEISMKSGNCVGRSFPLADEIGKVQVLHNGKYVNAYKIKLTERAIDESLNTFFPSEVNPITKGDNFVLLGIEMPDVFVKAAEMRLLKAACEYLKENSETKFTYQPFLDDIFIERDYDKWIAAKTPEKSIYWRLYAGLKFTFRDIPKNATDTTIPNLSVMIQNITIKEGEKYTPQIEITLNDEVEQSTLQKIQTSVSKISNMTAASLSLLNSYTGGTVVNPSTGGTLAPNSSVSAVLSEDLVSTKTIGNIKVGDKFEKGTSLEDVLRKLLTGEETPAKVAPSLSWVNCPTLVEFGSNKQNVSAKATLNSATAVKAVYLSINGQQETDITSKYDATTGYITYTQSGEYTENITYAIRCVFMYENNDYPVTITQTTRVVKPSFYGKFNGKKTSLTPTEIKGMTKFITDTEVVALSGGNTIAFAIPEGIQFAINNVTEDGFSADWSDWNSSTTANTTTDGVILGSNTQKYKVYFAYSEGGFGDVKGTIKLS